MKIHILGGALSLIIAGVLFIPSVHAETTDVSSTYKDIQALTTQIAELQKQLKGLTQQVRTVLKDGLSEGTTDEDVKKIQELLATDTTIYPEGKITGFFGPMTKEALKRFQKRHGLSEDGALSKETRVLLEKYLKANKGIPKAIVKTGDLGIKDAAGNTFSCVTDKNTGKILCSKKDSDDWKPQPNEHAGMEKKAKAAIDVAEIAITKAKTAIEESELNTEDAEEYLERAEAKFDEASDSFDDEKYLTAKKHAFEASRLAGRVITLLK